MKTPLTDCAQIIRSKNAGPFEITFDIIFSDEPVYRQFKKRNLITKKLIASLYHVSEKEILDIIYFDPARAVKINMKRSVSSGSPGETDVYGAQQHAPLLTLSFDLDTPSRTEGSPEGR